jgi:superfamily II DNA or RNA helicase
MPKRTSASGSELFIVDNSDADWKVLRYLHDWCQISKAIDIATGYFEIGSLLGLKDEWQKVDQIRILMGDEVSNRTKDAFVKAMERLTARLDGSIEAEKHKNDFLAGVGAVVEGIRSGKIQCRVYRKAKFHAKAYITHARLEVVGSSALVGSSNFTYPGLTENIELNVQITGRPVTVLHEWYEEHWKNAEDVTPEILRIVERHTRDYAPFEVYAKSLQEFFRGHEMSANEWEKGTAPRFSRVYPILDQYQKDGYHQLQKIAERYHGAFLCDGVGLGKTFIGLMLIEWLVEYQRKRVALIVPKSGRESVWEANLLRYLPHVRGEYGGLRVYNHSDLTRGGEFPQKWKEVQERTDAIVIDEAHHFRNPGIAGEGAKHPSRYRALYNIVENKDLFLLTATPVNNRLIDLQHMIELFSRKQADYFKDAPLGIHSLPGHFRIIEKNLERLMYQKSDGTAGALVTNPAEAEQVLGDDALFRKLVVQRSRAYVKQSQEKNGGSSALFPTRQAPRVAAYELKKTYGRLLEMVEKAFSKRKPLFSLAIYNPLDFAKEPIAVTDEQFPGATKGRQSQIVGLIRTSFLKRFESSASAFGASCASLFRKLLAWVEVHSETEGEKHRFERWKNQHPDLVAQVERQATLWDDPDADEDIDFVSEEMLDEVDKLDRAQYRVEDMLAETYLDLDQLAEFLKELAKFKPSHDDKLKTLIKLLKTDTVLKQHKVLIFSEFMDTARYLKEQLQVEGIEGVDEIDSAVKRDRGDMIRQFSPYYNGISSADLATKGLAETRVLISTDVLSEGLNLQDATRLINYDLHWNPVRLMQRIGRVDRRMDPRTEERLLAEHPDQKELRGNVVYWNFLPPEELNALLTLYSRVTFKTLRISKTFGIEGKKLLTPDDDYQALKDFTEAYEGRETPIEKMHLEYQELLRANPDLAEKLDRLPGRVFSGKEHPRSGTKAVFFCFALPAPAAGVRPAASAGTGAAAEWSEEAGDTKWYLYELATEKIVDEPTAIIDLIRSTPQTPRRTELPQPTLSDIRAKIEKHIKNTYLKAAQAPVGVKPVLKAWMELN